MRRKKFIRYLGLSTVFAPVVFNAAGTSDYRPAEAECILTPRETKGPFPTKDPGSLVLQDIRGDRTGVEMTVNITVQDKNNNCSPLPAAMVDIWHCDTNGNYSEYGGTRMQPKNLSSEHFLRGRQRTNRDGIASYKTIFPGWYHGRATHIHVQVFDASGKSLLVTQIAFPGEVCDAVYTTATKLYPNGRQDTTNERDLIFSDSLSLQMGSLRGNIKEGFILDHTLVVNT